jgi:hypothetical protein
MSAMEHTANSSASAPGLVQIKRGAVTEITYWAWHLKVAFRPEHERGTKLSFADGMQLTTSASVDEVLTATAIAMGAYEAVERAGKARSAFDSQDGASRTNDVAELPTRSSLDTFAGS